MAAYALGRVGPAAAPSVPDLARLAADVKLPFARASAVEALGRIGVRAEVARRAVARAARDPEVRVRIAAALAAWRLGGDAEASVEALLRLDGQEEMHRRALRALVEMGSAARSVLLREAKAGDVRRRETATEALRRIADG
jgi:hypothetical protein